MEPVLHFYLHKKYQIGAENHTDKTFTQSFDFLKKFNAAINSGTFSATIRRRSQKLQIVFLHRTFSFFREWFLTIFKEKWSSNCVLLETMTRRKTERFKWLSGSPAIFILLRYLWHLKEELVLQRFGTWRRKWRRECNGKLSAIFERPRDRESKNTTWGATSEFVVISQRPSLCAVNNWIPALRDWRTPSWTENITCHSKLRREFGILT